jgi:hypothetical protein
MPEIPFPAGTVVEKRGSKPNDTHVDGARGRVIRYLGPVPLDAHTDPLAYGYFVVWDDLPGIQIFVAGSRLQAIATAEGGT